MPDSPPAARAESLASTTGPPGPPRTGERRRREIGWRSRDILRAAGLVAFVWVVLKLVWFANEILFVAFLGVLFGLAVSAGVDRLERFRMPRGVGAALVVLSFLSTLYALGSMVAPTIAFQTNELKRRLPEAVERVEGWLSTHHGGLIGAVVGQSGTVAARAPTDTSAAVPTGAARNGGATPDTATAAPAGPLREGIAQQLKGASKYLFPFLTSTLSVIAGLLLILVLSVYIGADPGLYHRGTMHLFPRRSRERAGEVLSAMAAVLRKWLFTQLIAMLAIGLVTTVVLLLLGVRAAFALGVIAGLLEFIPTVGPILSAVPAIAMGFLDSPEKALSVLIAYVAIQQVENHLLIPLLMKGEMDLPPALTILSQALMALVFGFLGLLVAVPILAAVMVPVKMLYVEDVIGDQVTIEETNDDHDEEGFG